MLGLPLALGLFVEIELALDAVGLAVKEIDERPQQIGEILFEPCPGQHRAEGFDHGAELAADGIGLRQRARIGLVPAGAMAVKGKLVEKMRGRGSRVEFRIGVGVGEEVGAFVA